MSIFDIIIIITAIASFFVGMQKGLIYELAGFLGLFIGAYGAVKFSSYTETAIAEHFSFQGIGIVSFIITMAAIIVAVHFLSSIISKAVNTTLLGIPNKVLGGLFCVIRNLFIISCFICAINYFVGDILDMVSHEEKSKSVTYEPITKTAPYIFPYLDFGVDKIKETINNGQQ